MQIFIECLLGHCRCTVMMFVVAIADSRCREIDITV